MEEILDAFRSGDETEPLSVMRLIVPLVVVIDMSLWMIVRVPKPRVRHRRYSAGIGGAL
jgi:hypothetical protein